MYSNYHRHSYYSNIVTPDSPVSNEDYAIRATELGHKLLSGVEHGWCGRYIEGYELAKQYDLKFLFGLESYIVKNRFEKDNTNAHIVILAKNENGRKNINRIISEANITGFYYRARIDLDLLFSLPKDDVWITSACLGGLWKYDDADEIILKIADYFGNNFFLEVQDHNTEKQTELNIHILELSNQHSIPIIYGCDSHFIYPNQSLDRDDYLLSKHIVYEDEEGWFMDYPSDEEVYNRFINQGALTSAQIKEAMSNTNIFLTVEEYDSPIFTKDIKLPTLYPDKTQEEKNQILKDLIECQWEQEKNNVPKNKWGQYEKEITKELDIVIETSMADYFLLDYEIVKRGKELDGHITLSGRGSAPGFFLSKLLGFTTIDRLASPVKLFPERFITKERILEAGTLPDIDFNLGNPEIFAQAQLEILGENHSYPMVAFGTLKPKAAWKLYARAKNIDFDTANMVSQQIDKYDMELKHLDEDEKDSVDVLDYIEDEYRQLFQESIKYQGIVSGGGVHPCAFLLTNFNISEEIGIIKVKEHICTIMDGLWAENYKFLKNDLLKVSVVELIYQVYKRIGQVPHPLPELTKICSKDSKVWEVYKNAWTMGINQVEQPSTSGRVAKYGPQNISELSAFIAAVRPGFKSNYKQFEAREPFSYNIPSLDNIIQTEEFPQSYLIYQENAMQVMEYAGIPISQTYEIVKNIAKKRVEKVLKYKEQFVDGMTKKVIRAEKKTKEEAEKIAHMTWQIIEDSSRYSFNSCVSGNTIIQKSGITNAKFNPTIEEMFLIKNSKDYAKATNHHDLHKKYKRSGYGNALSMSSDNRIIKNRIMNICQSGIQKTYRVSVSNGSNIVCTMNHKFPTPTGEKKLEELYVGDYLYVKGKYEKTPDTHRFTDGNYENNHPKKGQIGFQNNENGASVIYFNYRNKKEKGNSPCEVCGCNYRKSKHFELHHIDGNEKNNIVDNYLWCCNSCHKKEHYKINRTKIFEKGIPVCLEKIIAIDYVDCETVYDIEMKDPNHNFVSESGLVTSNSHSYSVAGDSLYGAYLKSNYPLQFYEVFLSLLEQDGDKDRLVRAKEEAQSAFRISFPPYKFGQDNRRIVADIDKNEIMSSLASIKGFSQSVAEDMYELGQREYSNFLEFLIYVEESGKMTKKIEDLIKIDYFDIFGKNKKLSEFFEEFIKGKSRYSKKHSDKTKEKRMEQLRNIWDELPNQRLSFYQQIENEMEILGSVQVTYPEIDKKYVYVMELTTHADYAPRIEAYCMNNGKRQSIKIQNGVYYSNVFKEGSILECHHFEKKPSVTYSNGKYLEKPGEFTWWLSSYSRIDHEHFDKLISPIK